MCDICLCGIFVREFVGKFVARFGFKNVITYEFGALENPYVRRRRYLPGNHMKMNRTNGHFGNET
jgi:hypothetical protein